MTVTIFVADDHAVVRLGLQSLFEAEPDLQLIGEAADGLEVLPAVRRLCPQVLVLDLMLPGLHGLEVARQVTKVCPTTKVIILSMHANEAYVLDAFRNGASGYVLKGADASDLVHAIREVAAGKVYLSPPLSMDTVMRYSNQMSSHNPKDAFDSLTTREREVLQLTAQGLTSAQAGERLFISSRTVESHRANLMRKLGLRHNVDVIRYALRRGLLPIDS